MIIIYSGFIHIGLYTSIMSIISMHGYSYTYTNSSKNVLKVSFTFSFPGMCKANKYVAYQFE